MLRKIVILVIMLLASTAPALAQSPSVDLVPWGVTAAGQPIEKATFRNALGMTVSTIDFGATITSIEVPDRDGRFQNVVLGFPNLAAYEQSKRRYAAIIGRYAGRIGDAAFDLDGKTVHLIPGTNGVTLHGGPESYDKRVWTRRKIEDPNDIGMEYSLISPDGDQNFPGRLVITVRYLLSKSSNRFRIEYRAQTNAPTIVNLMNHGFFNLSGAGTHGLSSQTFQIFADKYAEVDKRKISTGRLLGVAGTQLDFRQPKTLTDALANPGPLLGTPPAFDHSLLLRSGKKLHPAAVIYDAQSGRRLEILTTQPSVQFNNGSGFDGSEMGAEGVPYQRGDGFAVETQHLPDSPHHNNFAATVLRPDDFFFEGTEYMFSVKKNNK